MIECTDKKIYKKRNRKKPKKRFFYFITFAFLITVCLLYSKYCITKVISDVCYTYTYAYSTQAVNQAVMLSVATELDYSDIIKIEKNQAGDIVAMNVSSLKVNSLSNKIVDSTKNNLEEKFKKGIPIPSLAFSGIKLLAGYGSEVYFKSITVTSVNCEFNSQFKSVGINQTLHSIYVLIRCEVSVNIPLGGNTEYFENEVLLSESVLVGKVPEVYLNGKLF